VPLVSDSFEAPYIFNELEPVTTSGCNTGYAIRPTLGRNPKASHVAKNDHGGYEVPLEFDPRARTIKHVAP